MNATKKRMNAVPLLVEEGIKGWCAVVLLLLAAGCSAPHQQIAPRTDELRQMERRTHDLINEYRASHGLKRLLWSDVIRDRALKHSERMASNRVHFSHTGFEDRTKEIATRIQLRASSENIGVNWGYKDPVTIFVDGWIKSPGHLENIVGQYDLTGVGIAKSQDGSYYATQIFVLTK